MRRLIPAFLVAFALLPSLAFAHTRADSSDAAAVRAAAVRAHQLSKQQAACQVVTISTVNRTYASLSWPAQLSKSCRRVAADGVVLLHESAGSWRFVGAGSSFKCPIKGIPAKVSYDLKVCVKP
jgi:hypothetical protein